MLLCHHSRTGADAVRKASPSGQLFVACVVVMMLLSVFAEAWELAALEVEIFATDIALEFAGSLGLAHWNLLELLLAGAVLALIVAGVSTSGSLIARAMRPAEDRPPGKIPI